MKPDGVCNPSNLMRQLTLLILLWCSVSCCLGSTEKTDIEDENVNNPIKSQYIVMFHTFTDISKHDTIIRDILGTSDDWFTIERNNPAVEHPSDFSLVQFTANAKKHIETLRNDPRVKHVARQRRYVGTLNQFEEDTEEYQDYDEKRFPNATKMATHRVGRGSTRFSEQEDLEDYYPGMRKLHGNGQIVDLLDATYMWDRNYTGAGVRVAVFDTGLKHGHSHFGNVVEITNWTEESKSYDTVGHGTFVAGVIGSRHPSCPGLAPDSEMYIFRVFNDKKISYTSWFLDAFNHVLMKEINILNLSIGGPDFMDRPFVEKVWELSANNVIVVSAIGNDGPLYGTLNNPADQLDVIGVGGLKLDGKLAEFSSRGMTTWEIPEGYGRVKPDVITFGQNVDGSRPDGECRKLSGTSVASPVVAGVLALLISSIPPEQRSDRVNVATLKQVLIEGAERISDRNIFEQGSGKVHLVKSYQLLQETKPRVSLLPASGDLTQCPYLWPYCTQPIFYTSMPIIVNITVINGMGVTGSIPQPPVWKPATHGNLLEVRFTYSDVLWPWTGYLAVQIRVSEEGKDYDGEAEGIVSLTVSSPPGTGETQDRSQVIDFPIKVTIVPQVERSKRILWDQYHSIRYPSGYFPRDALDQRDEPFDWNGDHLHTNFKWMWAYLRNQGYYVDILGSPYTCFDAKNYGALVIVDPEEEYFPAEIKKIERDVREEGLSLVIFADWYNVDVMKNVVFFDENTKQWWSPATGGSNIPALNDLLRPFDMAFGDRVFDGILKSENDDHNAAFGSGVTIARFPKGGGMVPQSLMDQTEDLKRFRGEFKTVYPLAIYPYPNTSQALPQNMKGRIALYGDSSCLDDSYGSKASCYGLAGDMLRFAMKGGMDRKFEWEYLEKEYKSPMFPTLPLRMEGADLYKYSKVMGKTATCPSWVFHKTEGKGDVKIEWDDYSPGKMTEKGRDSRFKEERSTRSNGGFHLVLMDVPPVRVRLVV
ncbi:membrane-bound transcription factor protease, site 1 [Planoprotostelium fungivorum]|uniref:Membrane-bound transcription factor protease, site 1 n=1 Tax=Planoprotostelium fungivorum TaxID=1890364 RepID=A0A2P6NXW7_9EUKA|nr:membrane-bound transcription factor protease, site 1 [Planoprotostelium fungivorum]